MKTKFAIGCLVQWYECDIIEEYVNSLKDAIKNYDGEIIVDFTIITNEDLEKCISAEQKNKCIEKIGNILLDFENVRIVQELHTIADYRREFNEQYCDDVDVLVWGESDMLVPKQMFTVLDSLHNNVSVSKYLATFGICKMWDNSWKVLEHPKFTNHPHSESNDDWWGVRYTTTKDEMNLINDEVDNLDVRLISPHKFNGCGLVISAEVIKSGVNIPKSVFFVHEDTAFMLMMQRVLGNIPQYHISNILLAHNRNHPKKRMHICNESGSIKERRLHHAWYNVANKMSESNYLNLFNPSYKSYCWDDVFKEVE
jgi:hypothetical protein